MSCVTLLEGSECGQRKGSGEFRGRKPGGRGGGPLTDPGWGTKGWKEEFGAAVLGKHPDTLNPKTRLPKATKPF